jgi:NAD(P)-dependent dehydrogenase (short-subunit alcohol dehydrogenase family)
MKDQVIVITGASRGIGAALADECGKRGAKLVLVGRDEAALAEVATRTGGVPVVADVTRRADHARVLATALERFGQVDVWVNNAGRGITRAPSQLTDEDLDDMFLVNCKSAVYGMQTVLPHLQARGRGQIVNVSTMLARHPAFPPRAAYAAAKAALGLLTANLREELRATHPGITLTMAYPGVVATDFGKNALHGGPDNSKMPGAQPVDECARAIADAIETPRDEVMTRPT